MRLGLSTFALAAAVSVAASPGLEAPTFRASQVTFSASEIRAAHGMALDPAGALLVADTYRYEDPARKVSHIFRVMPGRPREAVFSGQEIAGLERISDGYLIADFGASKVYETNLLFEVRRQWDAPKPWNAKRTADGDTYVVTYDGFGVLTPEGGYRQLTSDLDYPFDFLAVGKDSFWITEQGKGPGRVSLWTMKPNQKSLRRNAEVRYPWSNPEGIVEVDGQFLALDTARGELVQFNAAGRATCIVEGLGIPILIVQRNEASLLIFSNQTLIGPAFIGIFLARPSAFRAPSAICGAACGSD